MYRDYGFQTNFILLAGGCSFSSMRFSTISNNVVLSLLYSLKFSETALWSTLCEEMTFGEWIITVRYLYDMELCIEFWKKKIQRDFFTEGEERATGVGENKVNTWGIDNISLTTCFTTFVFNTAPKLLRIDSYNFWIVFRGMRENSLLCKTANSLIIFKLSDLRRQGQILVLNLSRFNDHDHRFSIGVNKFYVAGSCRNRNFKENIYVCCHFCCSIFV